MRTRRTQSSSDSGSSHITVLLHESIALLDIQPTDVVVDATLGGAGHAAGIVNKLGPEGTFIGFDLDAEAIGRARTHLVSGPNMHLIESNFRNMEQELGRRGITHIDKALFDLGWSGYQLRVGRGFSFLSDEPLLMTYGTDHQFTAADIVNEWEETSIADVIYGWGGERYARRIARAIVGRRTERPFEIASDLADCVAHAVPPAYRRGRIHPATKTFQALRIAVNDELGALREGLRGAWKILQPSGRIAVITFHSLEDALVKRQFVEWEREGIGRRITKKPTIPSPSEVQANPRSRSAKLRVIQKA